MEVRHYIEHSVDHELSANIIDLCPVGRSTNKPFRYQRRARGKCSSSRWCRRTMRSGTNLYAHVLRGKDHAHGAA